MSVPPGTKPALDPPLLMEMRSSVGQTTRQCWCVWNLWVSRQSPGPHCILLFPAWSGPERAIIPSILHYESFPPWSGLPLLPLRAGCLVRGDMSGWLRHPSLGSSATPWSPVCTLRQFWSSVILSCLLQVYPSFLSNVICVGSVLTAFDSPFSYVTLF